MRSNLFLPVIVIFWLRKYDSVLGSNLGDGDQLITFSLFLTIKFDSVLE